MDAAGNIYVAGIFSTTISFGPFTLTSSGSYDVFLLKYDPAGNVLWARSFGSSGHDQINSMACNQGGQVVMSGSPGGSPVTFGSITLNTVGLSTFLVCYDATGNEQWAKGIGGIGGNSSVAVNAYGESYLGGSFSTNLNVGTCATCSITAGQASSGNIYLAKLDLSGNAVWARAAISDGSDELNTIALDSVGNVYGADSFTGFSMAFGSYTLSNSGPQSLFLVKYDSSGNPLWAQRAYNSGNSVDVIATDPAGDVLITGTF